MESCSWILTKTGCRYHTWVGISSVHIGHFSRDLLAPGALGVPSHEQVASCSPTVSSYSVKSMKFPEPEPVSLPASPPWAILAGTLTEAAGFPDTGRALNMSGSEYFLLRALCCLSRNSTGLLTTSVSPGSAHCRFLPRRWPVGGPVKVPNFLDSMNLGCSTIYAWLISRECSLSQHGTAGTQKCKPSADCKEVVFERSHDESLKGAFCHQVPCTH